MVDITADTFNLSVAGHFDYASEYLVGNIDAVPSKALLH